MCLMVLTSVSYSEVFLALVNEYRRGVIDYPSFSAENRVENLTTAFKVSEEQLNIPSLIDPSVYCPFCDVRDVHA